MRRPSPGNGGRGGARASGVARRREDRGPPAETPREPPDTSTHSCSSAKFRLRLHSEGACTAFWPGQGPLGQAVMVTVLCIPALSRKGVSHALTGLLNDSLSPARCWPPRLPAWLGDRLVCWLVMRLVNYLMSWLVCWVVGWFLFLFFLNRHHSAQCLQ